jgi:hypothetical protein
VAWSLEINHVDVIGSGDATLIIAREVPPLIGGAPIIRSVLIDGGRRMHSAALHAYVGARLGVGVPLNAMICTHYDIDHMGGLVGLLLLPVRYNNTFVYDQGWAAGFQELTYVRYLRAINGMNDLGPVPVLAAVARTRVTARVQADGAAAMGIPPIGAPAVAAAPINLVPQWLLAPAAPPAPLAPADPLWNGAGIAVPPGAPTMRFIAANRYVRTAAGGIVGPIGGLGVDPKNEKSLAVELTFGNFRYYVGGDIETAQENSIRLLLNNADDAAGRVLAMKASHHGANTATSRGFVDRLRPSAAFISCGTGNQYAHPAQQTINVLDGYPPFPGPHAPIPPQPPNRPIDHYLTGYQAAGPPPLTFGGDESMTAGDPNAGPPIRGHIRVTVNAAQAAAPVEGQLYVAVQTAVEAALTAPGVVGAMAVLVAVPIADAAAEEALSFGPGPAAHQVITQAGGPAAAGMAADLAANGVIPPGAPATMMAQVVTAAALGAGATAADAAGAGAAAGTYYGRGTAVAVQQAVTRAVQVAGLGAGFAAAVGAAAAAGLPAAPSQFRARFYEFFPPHGPGNVVMTHR